MSFRRATPVRASYTLAMTRRVMILMVLALAFCVGCVSKPVLELHSARVTSASPAGVGMTLLMRVNNENSFDVKVRNVRAHVTIANGFHLPPVHYNPERWLPAGESTIVPVPVVVPWPMIGPLASMTMRSRVIHYRVTGMVDVTAVRMLGIESDDHQLDENGSISRNALIQAAGRGFFNPGAVGQWRSAPPGQWR